jgi:hypothetical protein
LIYSLQLAIPPKRYENKFGMGQVIEGEALAEIRVVKR